MDSLASDNSSVRAKYAALLHPVCLVALVAALLTAVPATAQDVSLGGFLRLDRRLALADTVRNMNSYNVFRPQLSARFERAEMVASFDLRFYDLPSAQSSEELKRAEHHFPSDLTVWEAFVRVSGLLLDPLDLTIGKQRVQWGTADGFNPTDRFNAYDLSDLTDFTARIPTWAVRAEYYARNDWRIEAVWTPTAHAPLLPKPMDGLLAGTAEGYAPPGPVASLEQHFAALSPRLNNSQYGFKVTGYAAGFDLSMSYFDGFDGIPTGNRFKFVATDTTAAPPIFDAHIWSALHRVRVVGADVATDWRGIGLWAEGALAFPDEIGVVVTSDTVQKRLVALDDRSYGSWTLGGDYTFPTGWYLNLQWARGLSFERGADQLHDYFVGRLEHGFLKDSVTLSLGGAVEVAQWPDWSNHLGCGVFPEIVYSPVDNIDLSIGAFLVGGHDTAVFGQWVTANQAYIQMKASF